MSRGDQPARDREVEQPDPAASATRRPLDRMQILNAAVAFIDQQGLNQLTMRRLGAHLGVEAMALYRYVPGREQLLDGVVEMVMTELDEQTLMQRRAESWPDYLQQLAHGVRDAALAHPRIFPLVASRPPAAPWLRPPLRSLRWVEGFLEGLAEYGFSPYASVSAYRSFATFLLGHLLLETSAVHPDLSGSPEQTAAVAEQTDLSKYPRTMALAPQLSKDAFGEEFEEALEDLINRLTLLLG